MKLIGLARQGNDSELRYTQNGDPVAGISLAYNYGPKDQSGKRATVWVDASLWGKRAEALIEYLTKGRLWYVEITDVHIETYEGRNGPGHKLVGRINEIQFAGGNDQQQGNQQQQQQQQRPAQRQAPQRQQGGQQQRNGYADATGRQQPQQQQRQAADLADMDDDIPF